MSQWAIEAEILVKKFVRRKMHDKGGTIPAERGREKKFGMWQVGRRQPQAWFVAVDGVSLQIQRGEVFGLLGPNGAGKTTTIRMLCTLLEPSSGTARVNDYDIIKEANQVRQSLGTVLAGERSIYWKLTARENLEYFAALYHVPPKTAKQRVNDLLKRMELSERADELVEKYSTGMKQRVAISRALLARPPILLLDEPTLGLDPQAARKVRQLIDELKAEGHTILLTTHYMEEADQLSDRIGIIDQGKIIALDTPTNLKQRIQQKDVIRMEVSGWKPEMIQALNGMDGIENLTSHKSQLDSIWELTLHTDHSRMVLPGLIERVNQNGTRLVNLNILQPSLEDVFIHLTGKALRD
ncbi:MAG TPA: ATP-binding cassette domain-containing protein [Anaerolineales bacterium]|nr:ATP-binding cassette domain-containing protein [Anaerolineales bacterium]